MQKRRQELIAEANEIRQQQASGKNGRAAKLDQIKRLDEQIRSRSAEQKAARGKVAFKSVDEVDREIERLDRQVNGGMMKLVDEKKALAEISNLRKQRRNFAQFDDSQKQIDELKAKIKEIKDSMEDPEAKALGERYNKIQAELDTIKAEQDEVYKNLSSLRDERSKLQAEQNEKFMAIKKLKDEYYSQKKAHAAWEREQREKARERQQAERERIAKERKMDRAQKMLAEASDPAYLEEIRRANSLLHFFDPSHKPVEKTPLLADKGLGAQAQRKVDATGIKGTVLVRKEDRDDDYLPAVKKGKKGKKSGTSEAAAAKTFNCPPSVIEDCDFVGVEPPMSAADVPAAMEKVKAKLEQWKADQPEQTRKVCTCSPSFSSLRLSPPLTPFRTLRRPRRRLSGSRPRKPANFPPQPPPTGSTKRAPARNPSLRRRRVSRTCRSRRRRSRLLHRGSTGGLSQNRTCSVQLVSPSLMSFSLSPL